MEWGAGFASGSSGFQSCPPSETWQGGGGGTQRDAEWGGLEAWSSSADLIDFSRFILWLDGEEPPRAQDPQVTSLECSLAGSSKSWVFHLKQNDLKMQQAVQMLGIA